MPGGAVGKHDGAKGTQLAFGDVALLLQHGSPKESWINPEGGRIRRTRTLPDRMIFATDSLLWLVRRLTGDAVD